MPSQPPGRQPRRFSGFGAICGAGAIDDMLVNARVRADTVERINQARLKPTSTQILKRRSKRDCVFKVRVRRVRLTAAAGQAAGWRTRPRIRLCTSADTGVGHRSRPCFA
jgi:hypothetical protein